MPKRSRPISLLDGLVVAGVVAVVCSVLSPVIAVGKGASALAACQTNLKRIGGAFRMYLADWDGVYPTNRRKTFPATYPPSSEVVLGKPGTDPATGKPFKSTDGKAWVEALYDYIEPITTIDKPSVWKCPAIGNQRNSYLSGGTTRASVSYAINYNLLEQPEAESRHDSNLMLCRELDRLVNACIRGSAYNNGFPLPAGPGQKPESPWLCTTYTDDFLHQVLPSEINSKLHGTGSNILFADGHVKCFDDAVFSNPPVWNSETNRWTTSKAPRIDVTR